MKIVSFVRTGSKQPTPGAWLGEGAELLDFTAEGLDLPRPDEYAGWFDLDGAPLRAATAAFARVLRHPAQADELRKAGAILPAAEACLVAPVPRPGKVICIGLNYKDHAAESGMALPERPLCFSKFSSCVVGPGAEVVLPPGTEQGDYEAELGVVIGRRAWRVSAQDAMGHVLGYTNVNDVSARDFQFADGQWQRGKSCDTFCPMGPFVATTDEVPEPQRLRIRFRLNGKTLQDSSTDQLIFGVAELVSQLSHFVTLEPGDLISTGTPPGVGFARKPPVYLAAGDRMEVEIEGLGVLANPVVRQG